MLYNRSLDFTRIFENNGLGEDLFGEDLENGSSDRAQLGLQMSERKFSIEMSQRKIPENPSS